MQLVRFISETLNGHLPLKHNSDRRQTWPKRVSDDPRHFIFRRSKNRNFANFSKFSNGRLPPEDGSVWPQTLGKHVSDDPRHFIFRRRALFSTQNFVGS